MIKGFLKPPPLGYSRMGNGKMEKDRGIYQGYPTNSNVQPLKAEIKDNNNSNKDENVDNPENI